MTNLTRYDDSENIYIVTVGQWKTFLYYIQKINFIIYPEYFDTKNIFSHPFIHIIKHKPNMLQDLSRQIKIAL